MTTDDTRNAGRTVRYAWGLWLCDRCGTYTDCTPPAKPEDRERWRFYCLPCMAEVEMAEVSGLEDRIAATSSDLRPHKETS